MKKKLRSGLIVITGAALLAGCMSAGNRLEFVNKNLVLPRITNLVYFSPDIYPEVQEIKEPTNTACFHAASNVIRTMGDVRLIRVKDPQNFDEVDPGVIRDFCKNNDAQAAIVPKIKYFKVGIGKYVFSNQVVVGMKLYSANGDFVAETSYDTFHAKARMLGSAENSIKIGTAGAIRKLYRELRARKMLTQKISER